MASQNDTRNRIIDAALEQLYERGYAGTTTRAIAQEAAVNEVTLFRHFGSKRNLFMAVIDRETDIGEEMTDHDFGFTGDLDVDLRMVGEQMAFHMVSRSKLIKIILMEATRDPDIWEHVSKTPLAVIGYITKYFEMLKDQGKVREGDPYLMAIAFFSFFFRTMVTNAFLGSDVFIEMNGDTIGGFVDLFINGIKAEV
jgi:AcrR family transcriptional regulator